MRQDNKTDVLVIGGGTPGLALACLLGSAGIDVTLAEKFPAPPLEKTMTDTRTTALMDGSINILKATGAWENAAPFAAALETLRIIDDSGTGKPARIEFKASEMGLSRFGFNIPNAPLRAALAETARKMPRVRMLQAGLSTYRADDFGISASFDEGSAVHAKLIVGADGRDSVTRETSGIQVWEHDYQQKAITCLIDAEKFHNHVSTEFHRPSGPFTLVPLPGNRASIVWVDFNEKADFFMALPPDAFEKELQEKSAGLLGTVKLAGNVPPQCWPLKALRAKNLTARRMALIAEAAHVIHPIGAQGLNLSLRDVAALAESVIDAARNGQDIGSRAVLETYERRRKADVQTRVLGTHGLNRMVSNDAGPLRFLRKNGLKALDMIGPLRAIAMQQGLAPEKDESRLARGEGL